MTTNNNLIILATLSSSVVNLSYETESYLTPRYEAKYELHIETIADWKAKSFNSSPNYSFHNEDVAKINTIISFTKNLLEKSKDIESEFVDIVNENFWSLI